MKNILPLIAVTLLLTACSRHPSDAQVRQSLPGTWTWERDNIRCTNTIAADGTFDYQLVYLYAEGAQKHQVDGAWQVKDGVLIETITNDSNMQHRVPRTNSAQITILDAHELSVAYLHFTNTEN